MQLLVGTPLGLVWLPCAGPTLGAAIGLAAVGEQMPMAFPVMASFGIGASGLLVLAGYASGRLLARIRPGSWRGRGPANVFSVAFSYSWRPWS